MPNIDSNFTHFLCIFVGHKCAKVKKIPKKRVACNSFAPERYASAFISYKTKKHRLYSERWCADYKWMFYLLKAMKF